MFDAELGQIFIKMRALLGLSLWDMARAVACEPTVVANLEAGALGELPPWPELARLVHAYGGLTGIDPQPILSRLSRGVTPTHVPRTATAPGTSRQPHRESTREPNWGQFQADPQTLGHLHGMLPSPYNSFVNGYHGDPQISHQTSHRYEREYESGLTRTGGGAAEARARAVAEARARAVVDGAAGHHRRPPPRGADVEASARSLQRALARAASRGLSSTGRGMRRVLRGPAFAALLVAVPLGALAVTAREFPHVLYAAVRPLPMGMARPFTIAVDGLVSALAPVRDGLAWIDTGDPRQRKSDRLPDPQASPEIATATTGRSLSGR